MSLTVFIDFYKIVNLKLTVRFAPFFHRIIKKLFKYDNLLLKLKYSLFILEAVRAENEGPLSSHKSSNAREWAPTTTYVVVGAPRAKFC